MLVKCSICSGDHEATNHRRPVEGCKVGRGGGNGGVGDVNSFGFSSFLSFLLLKDVIFSLSFVRRLMGSRSTGIPHYNCASWFEVGKGFFIK